MGSHIFLFLIETSKKVLFNGAQLLYGAIRNGSLARIGHSPNWGFAMKKIALVLCFALLASGNAFAQLDPDDDGIGVYFDPCACVNCLSLDEGQYMGYVVITHPTSPDGVAGWEATITVEGPALPLNWILEGDTINVGAYPEFIVGIAEPLINPYSFPAIVVAQVEILILNTDEAVNFYIDGVTIHSLPDRVPAYLDGGDYETVKPLQNSTGGVDIPVATINGDCAVGTEGETWGGVKALYR